MVNLAHREMPTLRAINRLRRRYPYAAALLTYVMIERLLKGYVFENRKDRKFTRFRTPTKSALRQHGGKVLGVLGSLSDGQFLNDVLCRMTLGDVERMLNVPAKQRSATDRNEAMHSNLYLRQEATLSPHERDSKNRRRLKRALKHLQRVFRRCTGLPLVEHRDGSLAMEPNSTVWRTGARVARSGR